ncbi:hypothetical protein [Phormidium sp. CCY1219]|uniref:hypothetical protein n=1 Tax=Phormidium sp. CCY1219 TaxID=2886104 RepID=UPI002D1E8151|nr:hypothetical protein [Phormidium sp. CCY1219]MEB3830111.1 hypothetical protein [Phormidium sp. CCY1219]
MESKESQQQRLRDLLNYLSDRIHPGDRTPEAALLAYLNRFEPVTSASSLRRWFLGQQFPWVSRRPLLARAIGVEAAALESFLLHGVPETSEFLAALPPIPPEFTTPQRWEASVDLDSEVAVQSAIEQLSEHLSLEGLIDTIDALRSLARDRAERLRSQAGSESARVTILGDSLPTIAEVLRDKNLEKIASLVDLPLHRLKAIARGEEPACTEVTLLAAALGIPVQQLEQMRQKQFGDKSNHSEDCPENCHR